MDILPNGLRWILQYPSRCIQRHQKKLGYNLVLIVKKVFYEFFRRIFSRSTFCQFQFVLMFIYMIMDCMVLKLKSHSVTQLTLTSNFHKIKGTKSISLTLQKVSLVYLSTNRSTTDYPLQKLVYPNVRDTLRDFW